jgi:predicted phosphodiesterase
MSAMMRIAVLADIHGNLPALEAVLRRIEELQPDAVVVDGDLINAVPFSAEVIDRVRQLDGETNLAVVRGNHEFYYLDFGTERAAPGCDDPARWGQLHWLIQRISPEQATYMAMLPDERTLYFPGCRPVRVTHGVPGRNRVGFYNHQSEAAIAAELGDVGEETLISAHTHVPVNRRVRLAADVYADPHGSGRSRTGDADGDANGRGERYWHVINPGSVGLPLTGVPDAMFAMLESVPEFEERGGWRATHVRVPYDRRPALAAYRETGMWDEGGVITRLFYWELVSAEPEIVQFYRWARERGLNPDLDIEGTFHAYVEDTGRDDYIRSIDPLYVMER